LKWSPSNETVTWMHTIKRKQFTWKPKKNYTHKHSHASVWQSWKCYPCRCTCNIRFPNYPCWSLTGMAMKCRDQNACNTHNSDTSTWEKWWHWRKHNVKMLLGVCKRVRHSKLWPIHWGNNTNHFMDYSTYQTVQWFGLRIFPFTWLGVLILTVACSVYLTWRHWFWLLNFAIEIGQTAGATDQQGMRTPPMHLIAHPVFLGVHVSPFVYLTCNSYLSLETDYSSMS
jgi:hypothetical protein